MFGMEIREEAPSCPGCANLWTRLCNQGPDFLQLFAKITGIFLIVL
jgi:hypothetical protein